MTHQDPYASAGVFPAVKKLGKEEMQKLFYRTTSSEEFVSKKWEPVESFDDIHNMGTKNGKYMTYRPSRAPMWARTMCKYTEQFVPKPLGDYACNRLLAETFRPSSKADAPLLKLGAKTSYKEQFPRIPGKKAAEARPQSCKPAQAKHVQEDSKLAVTRSTTHHQFQGHLITRDPAKEAFIPSHQSHVKDPRLINDYTTRYNQDFGPFRGDVRPPSPLVSAEDNSFRVNGSSVPNKVRDYINMKRAHSVGAISTLPPVSEIMTISQKDLRKIVASQYQAEEDKLLEDQKKYQASPCMSNQKDKSVMSNCGMSNQGESPRSQLSQMSGSRIGSNA